MKESRGEARRREEGNGERRGGEWRREGELRHQRDRMAGRRNRRARVRVKGGKEDNDDRRIDINSDTKGKHLDLFFYLPFFVDQNRISLNALSTPVEIW